MIRDDVLKSRDESFHRGIVGFSFRLENKRGKCGSNISGLKDLEEGLRFI